MILYQRISVKKELPKRGGEYYTNFGYIRYFSNVRADRYCCNTYRDVIWWRKRLPAKKQKK
jgi:hypothetical protein